jgi:hypothetical protein
VDTHNRVLLTHGYSDAWDHEINRGAAAACGRKGKEGSESERGHGGQVEPRAGALRRRSRRAAGPCAGRLRKPPRRVRLPRILRLPHPPVTSGFRCDDRYYSSAPPLPLSIPLLKLSDRPFDELKVLFCANT